MAKKYATGFPPASEANVTDHLQVVQSNEDADATLQQVFNLFKTLTPNGNLKYTTDADLVMPLIPAAFTRFMPPDTVPHRRILLPQLGVPGSMDFGTTFQIFNNANYVVDIYYADGTTLFGSIFPSQWWEFSIDYQAITNNPIYTKRVIITTINSLTPFTNFFLNTDGIPEGTTNKYYSDAFVQAFLNLGLNLQNENSASNLVDALSLQTNLTTNTAGNEASSVTFYTLLAGSPLAMFVLDFANGSNLTGNLSITNALSVVNSITGRNFIGARNASTLASTAKTLALTDQNGSIACTATSVDTTITIPQNSSVDLKIGATVEVFNRTGNRLVTCGAGPGVTLINGTPSVGNNGYFKIEQVAANVWQVINEWEAYSYNDTFSWLDGTSSAVTIKITRNNRCVTVQVPAFTITAANNSTGNVLSNTSMPVRFRPTVNVLSVTRYQRAATFDVAATGIDTSGNIIYTSISNVGFLGNGATLTIPPFDITYLL